MDGMDDTNISFDSLLGDGDVASPQKEESESPKPQNYLR